MVLLITSHAEQHSERTNTVQYNLTQSAYSADLAEASDSRAEGVETI